MKTKPPALIPELDVSDLDLSLSTYVGVLGFECVYQRPEERFVYLEREGAHLMLEEAAGPGRRFHDGDLERPFGRGINLQIEVSDAQALYDKTVEASLDVVVPLEERWYRQGHLETGNRQFVLADNDGYLLRFFEDIGQRGFETIENERRPR